MVLPRQQILSPTMACLVVRFASVVGRSKRHRHHLMVEAPAPLAGNSGGNFGQVAADVVVNVCPVNRPESEKRLKNDILGDFARSIGGTANGRPLSFSPVFSLTCPWSVCILHGESPPTSEHEREPR